MEQVDRLIDRLITGNFFLIDPINRIPIMSHRLDLIGQNYWTDIFRAKNIVTYGIRNSIFRRLTSIKPLYLQSTMHIYLLTCYPVIGKFNRFNR